jgi:3-methyladenine DNA glycosylase/8-oxoguanine DNA glycosylase
VPTRFVPSPLPIDIVETLRPMRQGTNDHTTRFAGGGVERASRTPDGPVSLRLLPQEGGVRVEAWGPGADWVLERAPGWCGALDDDADFDPPRGLVRELWRRNRGLRIPRTGLVVERLIPVVLEQKVTSVEARRAYQRLTRALAEPAPGPLGLTLPPDPSRVLSLPSYAFHRFGVEARRVATVHEVCRRAAWFDGLAEISNGAASAKVQLVRGLGPWSAAKVARIALGDADAVSVGDFHVPHMVSWALAREPRATDDRMLELLEPYRPHRGRVQRLLEAGHVAAPAFGPRMEIRSIERI